MDYNKMPDIESYLDNGNPTIKSPNSVYELPFYQTRDTLLDVETYKRFLENAISRFRTSRTYKGYKGHLIDMGLDKCQIHSNINMEMATIEMHHNMLTIFDISLIITEHILNTVGYITTFDLVELLGEEHRKNRIQLVMLSLTPHQLYHNEPDFFIHPNMCFGKWYEFLEMYKYGLTQDISYKILYYLKRAIDENKTTDKDLLRIRDDIIDWSKLNE